MAVATIKIVYAASSAVTISPASLVSSSTLLSGRESVLVDNSSNLYIDYHVAGFVTTGTTPTVGLIEVHAVGMRDDANWPDGFSGTDAAKTVTSAEIKASICKTVASMSNTTGSNVSYPFGPVSVRDLFGGTCPRKFLLFVTHSTVASLNATGANHVISVTPMYATSTTP